MNDPDAAQPVLMEALKLNENCDVALFNLAVLLHRYINTVGSKSTVLYLFFFSVFIM
jgi:hypothetical protein